MTAVRVIFNFISVILVLFCVHNGDTFNLSPQPNIVFREPKSTGVGIPKMRSSYFGFSLSLKQNSVLIGAPRAQSTLELQQRINETGVIYKCGFDKLTTCSPFVFDWWGNANDYYNQYLFNDEKKDFQWLGAAMDGSTSDSDKFVVCAPRLIYDVTDYFSTRVEDDYSMHGVCYWTTSTASPQPANVQKIASLRLKNKQVTWINQQPYYDYQYGELGLSVHITENNEEILIGAPGILMWTGTVIRQKANGIDIPNPMFWKKDDVSYFGFAVSSGYFDGIGKTKLLYVASAPQANLQQGAVYIFDIIDHYSGGKTIKIYHTFPGQQFGEYFGYSLLTEDFNNDGLTDVAIGAPYNSKAGDYENGAVYIYKNKGTSSNFVLHAVLRTDYEFSGRFGTTISKVGDINQDGYNDLVVAAPFEGNGVVYIYHGSANGLPTKYSQRIVAPRSSLTSNQMFGHGLSKGADINGNQYLDVAIGAPEAESVYIYKSYPVIRIDGSIKPIDEKIPISAKTFDLSACFRYESNHKIEFDVQLRVVVKLIDKFTRAHFQIDGCNEKVCELNVSLAPNASSKCVQLKASVTFQTNYIYKPIHMELNHSVINAIPKYDATTDNSEFCETCVALDPKSVRNASNVIKFDPGCKHEHCVTDLRVTSALSYNATKCSGRPSFKRGDSSLTINYTVENHGSSEEIDLDTLADEKNLLD
ncbi:integrin alpha-PS3-like [Sitodiplosis mosellana]|uniref:integrin alpha-PS3-like n=1 Tax=Sitodiplosis mosellana TaxID=263140 RepID=UPI002443EF5C|nr:integrin alpha-PS3-like [Sitodiplosis mosellana]